MRIIKEHLNCWQSKSEVKSEVLRGIKEIGSVLYWMGLLDIVLVSLLYNNMCNNNYLGLDKLVKIGRRMFIPLFNIWQYHLSPSGRCYLLIRLHSLTITIFCF